MTTNITFSELQRSAKSLQDISAWCASEQEHVLGHINSILWAIPTFKMLKGKQPGEQFAVEQQTVDLSVLFQPLTAQGICPRVNQKKRTVTIELLAKDWPFVAVALTATYLHSYALGRGASLERLTRAAVPLYFKDTTLEQLVALYDAAILSHDIDTCQTELFNLIEPCSTATLTQLPEHGLVY